MQVKGNENCQRMAQGTIQVCRFSWPAISPNIYVAALQKRVAKIAVDCAQKLSTHYNIVAVTMLLYIRETP